MTIFHRGPASGRILGLRGGDESPPRSSRTRPCHSRASSTTPEPLCPRARSSSPISTTSSPAARTWSFAGSGRRMSAFPSRSRGTAASRIFSRRPLAPTAASTRLSVNRSRGSPVAPTTGPRSSTTWSEPGWASLPPTSPSPSTASGPPPSSYGGSSRASPSGTCWRFWRSPGFCEHTRQGWNVGAPPYGYLAQKVPHPVPARRVEGATKTRLVPDPVRAPVVHQIFTWRVVEQLGYAAIVKAQRRPPPLPSSRLPRPGPPPGVLGALLGLRDPEEPEIHRVHGMEPPGDQEGGRVNPPDAWVWSPELTHEPIVTMEIYRAAGGAARVRKGSRNGSGSNTRHPDTCRSYVLRSFVVCTLCGNRMLGKTLQEKALLRLRAGQEPGAQRAAALPRPPTQHLCSGGGARRGRLRLSDGARLRPPPA